MPSVYGGMRFALIAVFCLGARLSVDARTATGPQCAEPPAGATWEQILPCVQDRKNVGLLLADGTELRGKMKRDGDAGCAKGEWCAVKIGSIWRGYKPVTIDRIVAVSFHRHMSTKRKLAATVVGVGTAVAATAWWLEQGCGEGIGVFCLGTGVLPGVTAGLGVVWATQGSQRMVRIVKADVPRGTVAPP